MSLHSGNTISGRIQLGSFSLSIKKPGLVIKPFLLPQYSKRDSKKRNTEKKTVAPKCEGRIQVMTNSLYAHPLPLHFPLGKRPWAEKGMRLNPSL